MTMPRSLCDTCRRPTKVCYCAHLPRLDSRTRVVFLQHPREAKVPVGTARMAHLALTNSELHHGVSFEENARVQELADRPELGAALLFPGEGARPLDEVLAERPPATLVVIDGTWSQAAKVLKKTPALQKLPRIAFTPKKPGNYRIRREPEAHCVSTIEAVVEVLGKLEGDGVRYTKMLEAFDWMVDRQLDHIAEKSSAPRRRQTRRPARDRSPPKELVTRPQDLVLVYAEANAHPRDTDPPQRTELTHLVAYRPATNALFEAVIAPRGPLAVSTPHHIGLSKERILAGESLDSALSRFAAFLAPDDFLLGWGGFAVDLLADEGFAPRPFIDLRLVMARIKKGKPGSVEAVAAAGGAPEVLLPVEGRAGVRLRSLAQVLAALTSSARQAA